MSMFLKGILGSGKGAPERKQQGPPQQQAAASAKGGSSKKQAPPATPFPMGLTAGLPDPNAKPPLRTPPPSMPAPPPTARSQPMPTYSQPSADVSSSSMGMFDGLDMGNSGSGASSSGIGKGGGDMFSGLMLLNDGPGPGAGAGGGGGGADENALLSMLNSGGGSDGGDSSAFGFMSGDEPVPDEDPAPDAHPPAHPLPRHSNHLPPTGVSAGGGQPPRKRTASGNTGSPFGFVTDDTPAQDLEGHNHVSKPHVGKPGASAASNGVGGGGLDFAGMTLAQDEPAAAVHIPPVSVNGGRSAWGLPARTPAATTPATPASASSSSTSSSSTFSTPSSSPPEPSLSGSSSSSSVSTASVSSASPPPSTAKLTGVSSSTSATSMSSTSSSSSLTQTASQKSVKAVDTNDMASIWASLDRALRVYWQTTKDISEQQSELRRREVDCLQKIKDVQQKVKTNESDQSAAVEAEDFERADQLNHVIESLKAELGRTNDQNKQIKSSDDLAEKRKTRCGADAMAVAEKSLSQLTKMKLEQENEKDEYVDRETSRLDKQEDRLNGDFDRVERSMKHGDADLDTVKQEEDAIELAIKEETKDVERERGDLQTMEAKLDLELQDLLQQVEAKRAEIRSNKSKLETADAAISAARTGHERKLKRIVEKRERIRKEQQQSERELNGLKDQRSKLSAESASVRTKETNYNETIARIAKGLKETNAFVERLQADEARRLEFESVGSVDQKEASQLQTRLSASSKKTEELRAALVGLETQVADHQKNISSVNLRIPAVEAEKKTAVTSRNFKAASSLTKEIKDLTDSKQDSESKLEKLREQVALCNDDLVAQKSTRDTIKAEIESSAELVDRNRFRLLLGKLYYLQDLMEQVDHDQSTSKELAPSAEGLSKQTRQAEHDSVNAELKACQVEVNELRMRHRWTQDFLEDEVKTKFDKERNERRERERERNLKERRAAEAAAEALAAKQAAKAQSQAKSTTAVPVSTPPLQATATPVKTPSISTISSDSSSIPLPSPRSSPPTSLPSSPMHASAAGGFAVDGAFSLAPHESARSAALDHHSAHDSSVHVPSYAPSSRVHGSPATAPPSRPASRPTSPPTVRPTSPPTVRPTSPPTVRPTSPPTVRPVVSASSLSPAPPAKTGPSAAEIDAKVTEYQQLQAQIQQTDKEIEEAADREDFDTADNLEASVKAVKSQAELLKSFLSTHGVAVGDSAPAHNGHGMPPTESMFSDLQLGS